MPIAAAAIYAEVSRLSFLIYTFGNSDSFCMVHLAHPDRYKAGSMDTLIRAHSTRVKMQYVITKPWPFRVTQGTIKAEYQIMLSKSTSGQERYMKFEKLD